MILVTGTGRSGTSTVARLLHEALGVRMGERFDRPSAACPHGSYEDLDFRELHMRFERGAIGLPDFRRCLEALAQEREELGAPWGLKDPRTAGFIGLYVAWFDPVVIVCQRDLDATVESWTRVTTSTPEQARKRVLDRRRMIDRVLRGRPVLDFSEPRGDDEVVEMILQAVEAEVAGPSWRKAVGAATPDRPRSSLGPEDVDCCGD